jgi:hypothetical protein
MNKKAEGGEIIGTIIGIVILAVVVYFFFGGCLLHTWYYDSKIQDIQKDMVALGCNTMLASVEGYTNYKCNDLVFEHNKLVEKRNNLPCVQSNP